MASAAGSGKDTVADYLEDYIKLSTFKNSLGTPIHAYCNQFFENSVVPRKVLQDFGESVRDIFGEDAWIKVSDKRISECEQGGLLDLVIIPDVRKITEFAHYCVEKGYLPIYVKVNPEISKSRLKVRDGGYEETDLKKRIETQLNFIEELPMISVKNIDERFSSKLSKVYMKKGEFMNDIYVIDNNGSLQDLKKQIEEWVQINHDKIYT